MKRNYYQKMFNVCTLLFILSLLSAIGFILTNIGMNALQSITYLSFFYQLVSMVYTISLFVTLISTFSFLVLIYYETNSRAKEDSLKNLWQSIWQTFSMRGAK